MKVYFHMNVETFSNSYLVVNEDTKTAIIIDPCKITKQIIDQIENGGYKMQAALITHNHKGHINGLSTLMKIYDITVYAAESEIQGIKTNTINGDGSINIGDLNISYFHVPGHTPDSIVYKIENVLFTGDTIEAGRICSTNSNYSRMNLIKNIKNKIFSLDDDTIIMSGHGPLTTIASEKAFNIDLQDKSTDD